MNIFHKSWSMEGVRSEGKIEFSHYYVTVGPQQ